MSPKSLFPLFLILGAAATLAAQPAVTDNSSVPKPGYTVEVGRASGGGIIGGPGPDQTWEFGALLWAAVGSVVVVDPASTPYLDRFAGSNYAWQFNLAAGSAGYTYMKVSGDKLEMLADGVTSTTGGVNYMPNPQTTFKFPFQYGDSLSDTYQYVGSQPGRPVSLTYDGYGTLKMPYGDYAGVIRIKQMFGAETNFIWYQTAPLFPLAIYASATSTFLAFKPPVPGHVRMTPEQFGLRFRSEGGRLMVRSGPGEMPGLRLTLFRADGRAARYSLPGAGATLDLGSASGIRLYRIESRGHAVVTGKLRLD